MLKITCENVNTKMDKIIEGLRNGSNPIIELSARNYKDAIKLMGFYFYAGINENEIFEGQVGVLLNLDKSKIEEEFMIYEIDNKHLRAYGKYLSSLNYFVKFCSTYEFLFSCCKYYEYIERSKEYICHYAGMSLDITKEQYNEISKLLAQYDNANKVSFMIKHIDLKDIMCKRIEHSYDISSFESQLWDSIGLAPDYNRLFRVTSASYDLLQEVLGVNNVCGLDGEYFVDISLYDMFERLCKYKKIA